MYGKSQKLLFLEIVKWPVQESAVVKQSLFMMVIN